jgi:hypothetical protein
MSAQIGWRARRAGDGFGGAQGCDGAPADAAARQAWRDERAAAALAAQDDAEVLARRWGPEPEFMLAGARHAC